MGFDFSFFTSPALIELAQKAIKKKQVADELFHFNECPN